MKAVYHLLADGNIHSGSALGETLGVSRAAIWKQIKKLQEAGLEIETVPGKGYRLPFQVEFLQEESIRLRTVWDGNVSVLDTVDSTNLEVRRQLKAGASNISNIVVVAEEQTHGQGRRGRHWASPYASNLYVSFSWPITAGMKQLEGLSLAVGLAVYRTLHPYGMQSLGLKWPNDVLVGRKKIAGILIDLTGDPNDQFYAVIGVGINVNQRVSAVIDNPWTSMLLETGSAIDRNVLLTDFLAQVGHVLEVLKEEGFAGLKEQWEAVHLWQEQQVILSYVEKKLIGVVKGELALGVGKSVQYYSGGEMTLRLSNDTRA